MPPMMGGGTDLLAAENRASRPGLYYACGKLLDEKFPELAWDPTAREYFIDRMMNPGAYASSGSEEKKDWWDRNIQPKLDWGEKKLKQGINWVADTSIKYNPIVMGIGAIDKDAGRQFEQILKDRKDKFGEALSERWRGLGEMVRNPLTSLGGMVETMFQSPLERFQNFANDPEKAVYGLGIDILLTRGAIKGAPVKGGGAAGRTAGEASRLGGETKTPLGGSKARSPLDTKRVQSPSERGSLENLKKKTDSLPGMENLERSKVSEFYDSSAPAKKPNRHENQLKEKQKQRERERYTDESEDGGNARQRRRQTQEERSRSRERSDAADAAAPAPTRKKKRGPVPRDQGGPHNEKILSEAEKLKAQGNEILSGGGGKERVIPTPGGKKSSRRPDIEYRTPQGQRRGRNIGKTKADGTPVQRELDAIDDLQGPGGLPMDPMVPYDR